MSTQTKYVSEKIMSYVLDLSLQEPKVLEELRRHTAQMEESNMQIAPEQGHLMRMLVPLIGAKKILEIGTFTGYSALSMAFGLPEEGQLIACDVSEEWTRIAQEYWKKAGVAHKIQLILAPATQTTQRLLEEGHAGTFDLVFIDADKENYDAYYEASLRLLRPNGLILIDNTLWSGDVLDPEVQDPETNAIRTLNEKISQDDRVESFLLPLSDGITMVRKKETPGNYSA